MSPFDERWKICARRARQAEPSESAVPFGFVARVLAGARPQPESSSMELAWQRLTWRWLAVVGTALLVCAAMEWPHLGEQKLLEPGIENTVAQLVWSL